MKYSIEQKRILRRVDSFWYVFAMYTALLAVFSPPIDLTKPSESEVSEIDTGVCEEDYEINE